MFLAFSVIFYIFDNCWYFWWFLAFSVIFGILQWFLAFSVIFGTSIIFFWEISKSGGEKYCLELWRNPFDQVWEIQQEQKWSGFFVTEEEEDRGGGIGHSSSLIGRTHHLWILFCCQNNLRLRRLLIESKQGALIAEALKTSKQATETEDW